MCEENDLIYSYSSEQALDDGILFDITQINSVWKSGLFNYVTTNLMNKGYMKDSKINIPNILDLLNQAREIVRQKSQDFKELDYLYTGSIEFPDGEKQQILISQNETGKYTIMLPEDY